MLKSPTGTCVQLCINKKRRNINGSWGLVDKRVDETSGQKDLYFKLLTNLARGLQRDQRGERGSVSEVF